MRMARSYKYLAVCLVLLGFFCALIPARTVQADTREAEPAVYAYQAGIIVDRDGNKLWGVNEDTEMPMASITKIMTAVVYLEEGPSLDTQVIVSEHSVPDYSQLAGLVVGDVYSLDQLMKVMLVYSANDAAVMIGRAVAGEDEAFVNLMNEKASELGLHHTHFANPHGLEAEGHYSCASDLVILGRYALEHHPYIARTVSLEKVTIPIDGKDVSFESTDELLSSYPGTRGIKTGRTENGSTFLGCCERGGIRYYTCILGCETSDIRFDDTRIMFDWAYSNYDEKDFAQGVATPYAAPFAYHFGLWLPVSYTGDTVGFVERDGGAVSFSRIANMKNMLVDARSPYGSMLWEQDGRTVAASSLSCASEPQLSRNYGFLNSQLLLASEGQARTEIPAQSS